jgi:hypothetical protein
MKILHYISPGEKEDIRQYVELLSKAQQSQSEVMLSQAASQSRWLEDMYAMMPDVIHIHGCWHKQAACALIAAHRRGFCTVLSPHGSLEPWIIKQHFTKDKLPKIILWQRRAVKFADAVHVSGRIENQGMEQLGWNKRISTIANPQLTSSTSFEDIAEAMNYFYNAAIEKRNSFYNMSVKKSLALTEELNIKMTSAEKMETTAEKMLESIKRVRSLYFKRHLTTPSLLDLATTMRNADYNEDELARMLAEDHLTNFTARLEQTLSELTLLEEGFLPIPAINDDKTWRMKTIIAKQLKL